MKIQFTVVSIAIILSSCAEKSNGVSVLQPTVVNTPKTEVGLYDIPVNVSDVVKAQLVLLRQLLDNGVITRDDYDTRRSLLLGN